MTFLNVAIVFDLAIFFARGDVFLARGGSIYEFNRIDSLFDGDFLVSKGAFCFALSVQYWIWALAAFNPKFL